ncbi:MAG: hypothetical protein Q7S19_00495 [bacterium]|nr:hypothetical protein [bacterium]
MKCPNCDSSCSDGTIRVIPMRSCSLGHPALICDTCRHGFMVAHGPENIDLLPPEASVVDCGEAWNEDEAFAYGLHNLPTVEEMHELIALFSGEKLNDIYGMIGLVYFALSNKGVGRDETMTTEELRKFMVLARWIRATPPGF